MSGEGAWVENKKYSLTFHYRDVPVSDQESYRRRASDIIQSYGFVPNAAHAAVEAKPPVVWNKGNRNFFNFFFSICVVGSLILLGFCILIAQQVQSKLRAEKITYFA